MSDRWLQPRPPEQTPSQADARLADLGADRSPAKPRFARTADIAGIGQGRAVAQTPSEQRAIAHEERWRAKAARGR